MFGEGFRAFVSDWDKVTATVRTFPTMHCSIRYNVRMVEKLWVADELQVLWRCWAHRHFPRYSSTALVTDYTHIFFSFNYPRPG